MKLLYLAIKTIVVSVKDNGRNAKPELHSSGSLLYKSLFTICTLVVSLVKKADIKHQVSSRVEHVLF